MTSAAPVAQQTPEYVIETATAPRHPDQLRLDAAPTKRRIQALIAHGYSTVMICEALEWEPYWLDSALRDTTIQRSVADYVARRYPALAFAKPAYASERSRQVALREQAEARSHGWLGPLDYDDIEEGIVAEDGPVFALIPPDSHTVPADAAGQDAGPDPDYVDPVAIELAIAGMHPRLTLRERNEAIKQMRQLDFPAMVIADSVNMTYKSYWQSYVREGAEVAPVSAKPAEQTAPTVKVTKRRKTTTRSRKKVTTVEESVTIEMLQLDFDSLAA